MSLASAGASPADDDRLPRVLRALRHRDYRLFVAGQAVSLCGTWLHSVAQAWLVYRLTGSSVLLGLVAFCGQLPLLLLSPVAGTVSDRMPRRRLLIATQSMAMTSALLMAALTLSGHVHVGHVLVLAALLGISNAFDVPARQSFVVEMVGKEDLANAIALNSSVVNGARLIGPAIAGALIAAIGEGWCFLLNGASYLAVIAALLAMRVPHPAQRAAAGSALAQLREGVDYAAHDRPVRSLLLLMGAAGLLGMPFTVLLPVFAERVLGGGAGTLGLLTAATGAGALAGALTLAVRASPKGLSRWLAVAMIGLGTGLVLLGASRHVWLSAAVMVLVGCSMMLVMAIANTLLQDRVPDALRGRMMGLYSMMLLGLSPFGALAAGTTASHFGAPFTVTAAGLLCLVAGAAYGLGPARSPHDPATATTGA
jgi:MFS family permease